VSEILKGYTVPYLPQRQSINGTLTSDCSGIHPYLAVSLYSCIFFVNQAGRLQNST